MLIFNARPPWAGSRPNRLRYHKLILRFNQCILLYCLSIWRSILWRRNFDTTYVHTCVTNRSKMWAGVGSPPLRLLEKLLKLTIIQLIPDLHVYLLSKVVWVRFFLHGGASRGRSPSPARIWQLVFWWSRRSDRTYVFFVPLFMHYNKVI